MNWELLLSTLWLGWILALIVWIVMERRTPTATLAWIMSLGLIPVVGVMVYLLFGPRRLRRRRIRYADARRALHTARVQLAQHSDETDDVRQLMRLGVRAGSAPPDLACVTLYDGGDDTYAAILSAVRAATQHVHVEYYIWEDDASGRALRDALIERARAGVVVRVLVDALGSASLPRKFFDALREAGGKVAAFNPVRLLRLHNRLVNFRTHRKIVVCDGAVGFTGGINISDCHAHAATGATAWRDTHLRMEGPAVRGLQWTFAENWHFATEELIGQAEFFPAVAVQGGVPVQVLRSGPDRDVFPIYEFQFAAIAMADTRVWITTPYLVPDPPMMLALESAVHRGVDVRVLVPAKNDSRLVAAAMRSYYEELLAKGVKVFEYNPRMLHAKTMVVDNEIAVVGTANMDSRSFRLNFEVAAVVYDSAVNASLGAMFERDLLEATALRPRVLRAEPFASRLFEATARLFSPIL